jgi:hypothetical protein
MMISNAESNDDSSSISSTTTTTTSSSSSSSNDFFMEDLCVTSIALSHWVNWLVVVRMNWHHHVEVLLHEKLFHVKYRMSIGSFNKLLDLLHTKLQL